MKVKVHDGSHRVIECDSFKWTAGGSISLLRYDKTIAIFGPGFRVYLEIEYDHYDRGS